MNSNELDFNWHRYGVWMVIKPDNTPEYSSIDVTPYSCRASFSRFFNRSWTELNEVGYYIQEFLPAQKVMFNVQEHAVANESYWRYPANGELAPPNVGVQLLTIGGIQVTGIWCDDGGCIAWAPKIKRNKDLERRLGL